MKILQLILHIQIQNQSSILNLKHIFLRKVKFVFMSN